MTAPGFMIFLWCLLELLYLFVFIIIFSEICRLQYGNLNNKSRVLNPPDIALRQKSTKERLKLKNRKTCKSMIFMIQSSCICRKVKIQQKSKIQMEGVE